MNEPSFEINTNTLSTIYSFNCVDKEEKKLVNLIKYTTVYEDDITIIANLAFGPLYKAINSIDELSEDEISNIKVNDEYISNSGQRDLILSTVAQSIYMYTHNYRKHHVLFRGSCPTRTRLYRMAINKHYDVIFQDFNIFGVNFEVRDGQNLIIQSEFSATENYDAFLVYRK